MPKVVTFSVFLPSLSSSSAVCANAGPHAVHNSNAASRFFMIAPLVGGATLYPAPVRRYSTGQIFASRSDFAHLVVFCNSAMPGRLSMTNGWPSRSDRDCPTQPPEYVGRATSCNKDNDVHWRRVGLGPCDPRQSRQRVARGQMPRMWGVKVSSRSLPLARLFDHLVGAGEQCRRYVKGERMRRGWCSD